MRDSASEYDVDWNETDDGHDAKVIKALKEHREKKEGKEKDDIEEAEEDEAEIEHDHKKVTGEKKD